MMRGLRKSDILACTLFNIALEKIHGTRELEIYNKSIKILAYAEVSHQTVTVTTTDLIRVISA
jgi:hypothetical protein